MSNATEAAQYYQLLSNRLSKRDYTVQLENLESQDDNSWTTEFSFYPNKNSLQNKEAHVVYPAKTPGHYATEKRKNSRNEASISTLLLTPCPSYSKILTE